MSAEDHKYEINNNDLNIFSKFIERFFTFSITFIELYIYIFIYIYIYKSGHKWFTTHRVLKSHRSNMSVIYMLSWKSHLAYLNLFLWALSTLLCVSWITYDHLYIYIYIYNICTWKIRKYVYSPVIKPTQNRAFR